MIVTGISEEIICECHRIQPGPRSEIQGRLFRSASPCAVAG